MCEIVGRLSVMAVMADGQMAVGECSSRSDRLFFFFRFSSFFTSLFGTAFCVCWSAFAGRVLEWVVLWVTRRRMPGKVKLEAEQEVQKEREEQLHVPFCGRGMINCSLLRRPHRKLLSRLVNLVSGARECHE